MKLGGGDSGVHVLPSTASTVEDTHSTLGCLTRLVRCYFLLCYGFSVLVFHCGEFYGSTVLTVPEDAAPPEDGVCMDKGQEHVLSVQTAKQFSV